MVAGDHRTALLDAATHLFAVAGPDAVSIREVAEVAGCSHTLVGRHFGSKDGLRLAVIDRMAEGTERMGRAWAERGDWTFADYVGILRANPDETRLLVRSALGQLPDHVLDRSLIGPDLVARIERRAGGDPDHPSDAARIAAHAALLTALGQFTCSDNITYGSRVEHLPIDVRDEAIATAAELVADLPVVGTIDLAIDGVRAVDAVSVSEVIEPRLRGRDETERLLLDATIDLFSSRGSGAITTRSIAQRAGVNQGLIYHYFGSKEALVSAAIDVANVRLEAAAIGTGSIDVRTATRSRAQALALMIMTRLQVDGHDLREFRSEYRIFDALLARYPNVPTGDATDGLADPRLAVLAATSCFSAAVVWDGLVRRAVGLPADADIERSMTEIVSYLLARSPMSTVAD